MTTPVRDLVAFTIDCSDAAELARFYADLAGAQVTAEYPEYGYAQATLGPHAINFQTVHRYAAPQWPGQEHPSSSTWTSGSPIWTLRSSTRPAWAPPSPGPGPRRRRTG